MSGQANYTAITDNLSRRSGSAFKSMIIEANGDVAENSSIIISSPSDEGVIRNGGRFGAQFAPEAILACLGKMSLPKGFKQQITHCKTNQDKLEFEAAQAACAQSIQSVAANADRLLHLGGGHDFIFPLVDAQAKGKQDKILILNIDAHLDTRTDSIHHSGTPFRQMEQLTDCPIEIVQYGIQNYANAESNYASFQHVNMLTFSYDEASKKTQGFTQAPNFLFQELEKRCTANTTFILSLDCDAIHAAAMSAVSCVNPMGLPDFHVSSILDWYLQTNKVQKKIMGIYEFNPLYDDLSQRGAKFVSHLCYRFFTTS